MRVIVSGSRRKEPWGKLGERLHELPRDSIVIEGGAGGVDHVARQVAPAGRLHVATVKTLWDIYPKAAGPIRNEAMLDLLEPHLVIAYPDDESKGTCHMIEQAEKRGIEIEVYPL